MNKNNVQAMKYAFRMTFCQDLTPVLVLLVCALLTIFLMSHGFLIGLVFFPLFGVIYAAQFFTRYDDWFMIRNNDCVLTPQDF